MKTIKDFSEIIFQAEVTEIKEEKIMLLELAITLLKEQLSITKDKEEYYYLLGYCWYQYPLDTNERSENVLYFLHQTLELNSTHNFAMLYLGYLYYDNKNYEKAISYFDRLDSDYFLNIDQKWRVIKNTELIICCRIYINKCNIISSLQAEIEIFAKNYISNYKTEYAYPSELILAIYKCIKNQNSINRSLIEIVCELMVVSDLSTVHVTEYQLFKQLLENLAKG